MHGHDSWLGKAIYDGMLVAVTDVSYIREGFPDLYSVAFILENSTGGGRVIGYFPEASNRVNAYRRKSLGLMVIPIILFAADRVCGTLGGRVAIYSSYLGAHGRC